MKVFESLIKVTEEDLDELNHVNNVRYVQWVQDIASAHWLKNAGAEILKDFFWVMINHNIAYKKSALLHDDIKLKTYVIASEGYISTRIVEISNNKTGLLLAKSETKWCLMSMKTKRPTKITKEIVELFQ